MRTSRRRPPRMESAHPDVPQPVDEDLARAATAYFPEVRSLEAVAGHENLAKVDMSDGAWCVRRWPAGTPLERVRFVHALLNEARSLGIGFVPTVAVVPGGQRTELLVDSTLYDAQSWLPGRAPVRGLDVADESRRSINRPSHLPAATMTAAVRAIAAWHATTEAIARRPDIPQAPLDAVLRAVRAAWERDRERLRRLAPRTPHIQRWIRTGEIVLAGAIDALAAVEYLRARPRVVGHLNLWPAHLLVARVEGQDQITGLLDFGEAAASSPLVDLVQLIGHFNGWTGAAAEDAIGAYADVRPLAPEERRLLPAVAGLDLLAETGRLLTLGYATPAVAGARGGDAVRAAASSMLLSLEAVAPAVQRGDRPEPSKARKWTYRPRPAEGGRVRRPPDRKGPTRPGDKDASRRRDR